MSHASGEVAERKPSSQVYVGVGTNIDREKHARMAVAALGAQFGALTLSPVYESTALGFDGPDFYNFVIGFETNLTLSELVQRLKAIEESAGRKQGEKKYSSRTLDIDVLLFGEQDLRQQGGNIPRDEIASAAHVLKPLADIWPDGRCALVDGSFSAAWAAFDSGQRAQGKSGQSLRVVRLDLSPEGQRDGK